MWAWARYCWGKEKRTGHTIQVTEKGEQEEQEEEEFEEKRQEGARTRPREYNRRHICTSIEPTAVTRQDKTRQGKSAGRKNG